MDDNNRADTQRIELIISDVNIPFSSLFKFSLRLVLALMPALFIGYIIWFLFTLIFGRIFGVLFT